MPVENDQSKSLKTNPWVAYANDFQFNQGQRMGPRVVQSRMLVWCRSGQGRILVDGNRVEMTPGCWAFLPWEHELTYESDASRPLLTGGFHLIPAFADNQVRRGFRVYHSDADKGPPWEGRGDADLPGIPRGLVTGQFQAGSRLLALGNLMVQVWRQPGPDEESARSFGSLACRLLAAELRMSEFQGMPGWLFKTVAAARKQLEKPWSVSDLAGLAGVSRPTLTRGFRTFLGTSPKQWLIHRRLQYAEHLLTSTSISIGEVASRVGYEDPFQFTKIFRKHRGSSPQRFRNERMI